MKKRLKTHQLILLGILIALMLACGAVYAYMFMRTGTQSTAFVPAKVDCEVEETYGNNVKSSITVKNTGNIDAYIRVRLVSYWVDADGNIVAKASPTLSISPAAGWIPGSDNIYYYSSPVEPTQAPLELLASPITLEEEDGYRQVVDVFAEAIQAKPVKAAEDSWKVDIDNAGKITGERTETP